MKNVTLWALVFLLFMMPGSAGCEQAPGGDALSVTLERFEASGGMASMTLLLESRSDRLQRVCLIEPTFNGAPAAFLNGWNTDEIALEADGVARIDIAVCADGGDDAPESVSLRFAADGCISSPMTVRCKAGGLAVTQAAFEPTVCDPPVMSEQSILGGAQLPGHRVLNDQLSTDELARLEYGQAVVCLREVMDGEDCFIPFCTLPASVDEGGAVSADYSGIAVTFSDAPEFPLCTIEEVRDGVRAFFVSRIVLSGDAVFYADLSFEFHEAADGALAFDEFTVNSDELGGVYHRAPCALFSEFSCANAVLQLGGDLNARVVNDRFISVPLERPLEVEIKSAAELGDLYAYFEYFFTGGRSAVHAPFPL